MLLAAGLLGVAVAAVPSDAHASGCHIRWFQKRSNDHVIQFKARVTCSPATYWKVTIGMKRRRRGPDQPWGALLSWVGRGGGHSFSNRARCKRGNRFDGHIWVQDRGTGRTIHRVKRKTVC